MTATRDSLLASDVFFELVDEVLVDVGREPLPSRGSQRRIITVCPEDRVLQILAGAGSGKTEMLVWRVLYELLVLGTPARRLIVTTFTRKAATELAVRMVERSDALLEQARKRGLAPADPHVHDLRIGTLHSLCDALLAEFDAEYMAAGTQVIDETETRVRLTRVHRYALGFQGRPPGRVIDRLLAREELVGLFRAPWDGAQWPGNTFDRVAFLQAVLGQHTETWMPRCAITAIPNGIESTCAGVTDDLIALQQRWVAYLDEQSILDFATIQSRFHSQQDVVLDHVDHVFVDEFQDTNPVQFAIHLRWLARAATRLTVVGDDDQAMYRFRGSDIACFTGLEAHCQQEAIGYRQEKLEENWRSTKQITRFAGAFRDATVLSQISMDKKIRSAHSAATGQPPRLLRGPWQTVCDEVAAELDALGAGRLRGGSAVASPSVAILLFSTSERESQRGRTAALDLRRALEGRGLRVYNPRNKTAARPGSPVHTLAALLSYLIDPVISARAGARGRSVLVWASCNEPGKAQHSPIAPPTFPVGPAHANIQKKYRGSTAGIRNPNPSIAGLLAYLDQLRDDLVAATTAHQRDQRNPAPRLTMSGVVARLLAFPEFRRVGFTAALFREALFTQLLEANVAPTRRTRAPLDRPLAPTLDGAGKIVWPDEMWTFLTVFGTLIQETPLDDVEDDAFAEDAISLLTFHQAKGLEFDHVYVGLTGRQPAPHSVLQTMLFSGQRVRYRIDPDGQPQCSDSTVNELALADRERELYVALTRAKQRLTILHDPNDARPMCSLNPALDGLFAGATPTALPSGISELRWTP